MLEILKESDEILKNLNNLEHKKVSITKILEKDKISKEELIILLTDDSDENLILMAHKAKRLTEKYFGKAITLFTPLYLSNYCLSPCDYCGFSGKNKIFRKKLNQEEIVKEYEAIKRMNIDSILLLTGCDQINTPFEYILNAVKLAKNYFSEISIEVYPLKEEEYEILVKEGLTGVVQYQETYNQEKYKKLHPIGPKSDYEYRLYTQERALKAGVYEATVGVLLGLHDPIEDVFKTILHAEYLSKKYPKAEINISFPRFRDPKTGFKPQYEVNEKSLLRFIFCARIYLPHVGITISTRESSKFRDSIIGYGVTKMSAGSRTTVGGYHKVENTNSQFETDDKRSVNEIVKAIKDRGYRPEFTNWIRGGLYQ